jgi:hypothetical protein
MVKYDLFHIRGLVVFEDKFFGMQYVQKAADLKDEDGLILYSIGLLEGWGGQKNPDLAKQYYQLGIQRYSELGIDNPFKYFSIK